MTILQENVGLTNEDLRKIRLMRPGMPVDLQVTSVSSTKRVRTEFIGMDGTRNMIIRFPDEGKWGSLRDAIYKDNTMVVRYILEDETGEVIAFKAKVILVLTKPSHLVFTTFPLAIQSHDLRAEKRAQIRVGATLLDATDDREICHCLVRDISPQGCRISVERATEGARPDVKQQVKMHFPQAAGKELLLRGTVMNNKSNEVMYFYGIKFESSEADVNHLLTQLMISAK
ncbi:MAG: hypothetical protein ACI965_000056 [Paraglaciecola sp.]|jgi:hypothetical protein